MSGSLAGKRVVVTRAAEQAGDLVALLAAAGAVPVLAPAIVTVPVSDLGALDAALRDLTAYDWLVLTSANGARVVADRLTALGVAPAALAGCRLAAVGPATAAVLLAHGARVDLQPAEYVAEALVAAMAAVAPLAGRRVLLARAAEARPTLPAALRAGGAAVDDLAVYRTEPAPPDPAVLAAVRAGVDVVTFTSGSTVRHFLAGLGEEGPALLGQAVVACIGPITARAARAAGLEVAVVAEEYTATGLVVALAAALDRPPHRGDSR